MKKLSLLSLLSLLAACGSVDGIDVDAQVDTTDAQVADAKTLVIDGSPMVDGSPIDASPPPTIAFDVAYVSEWNLNLNDLDLAGMMIIINKGTMPFNMNSVEIRAITDDHIPTAFSFLANPHDAIVNPGFAGGWVWPSWGQQILDSGLVPESRVDFADENSSVLTMRMANAPVSNTSTFDINVELTIAIAGLEKKIPILIHVLPFPTTWADTVSVARISAP